MKSFLENLASADYKVNPDTGRKYRARVIQFKNSGMKDKLEPEKETTVKQNEEHMANMEKYVEALEKNVDFRSAKELQEKKLTPAELKKREEVAKAIERENPDMPMGRKMAIATATAKKVAEEMKPYVSHSGTTAEVLDSKGNTVASYNKKEHGVDYIKKAQAHLKKHFNSLKEEVKVGDKVHLGVGTKGGAGYRGTVHKIDGETVHVNVGSGKWGDRIVKGHISKLTKEEVEQIDELSAEKMLAYRSKAVEKLGKGTPEQDAKRKTGIGVSGSKIKQALKKEEVEIIQEVNHREFASHGLMHPTLAKMMVPKREMDFYHSKTGDKLSGVVVKNDGSTVQVKAHGENSKMGAGQLHTFKVSSKMPEMKNEETGSWKTETEWKKSKPSVVTDKSGAKHTPMSRVRDLARKALAKTKKAETIEVHKGENDGN